MAENPVDVSDLKSRLPSTVPESVIRSTLAKCQGDKKKCFDTLNATNWRHSALDAHLVSPEHLPPPMRRTNTYGPDVTHETKPQYQSSPWKTEKGTAESRILVEAQRRQLEQLQKHCDELTKQLSWAKSESDAKKKALTELRCIKIPTAQELEDEKDLIRTLESDVAQATTSWQCNFCSFKNHTLMTSCEKCFRSKGIAKPR